MRFSVEARLLDHFGIAMYNTVEKAIAELVANSYDADATEVQIEYGPERIVVRDNGSGMTPEEVESDYLRLGRNRRAATGQTTPRGRAVIGNKGIGKLAGFGIARRVHVTTARGGQQTGLVLDRAALEGAESLESYDIEPEITNIPADQTGTEVVLDDLLPEVTLASDNELRAALARHLPSRPDWRVLVNGEECTAEAIPGDRFPIDDEVEGFGRVRGFYVVAESRQGLTSGFAVRVRGRVVQEHTLFGLNQQAHGFFALTRIVGELEPDFIDPETNRSERDDFVINTSRTGLNADYPEVQALETYARDKLRSIAQGLTQARAEERKRAAFQRNPEYETRLKALGPEVYGRLDAVLNTVIGRLARNESRETIDELVDLIIRYYESDAVRVLLDSVRNAEAGDVQRLAELLAQYGAARIGEVAALLHSQLEVIQLLYEKVTSGALEQEIHHVIAENVWLLRESLSYWFDNRAFSTQLRDRLADQFTFASASRPDLACYDDRRLRPGGEAGQLVVVEFKRPGIQIGSEELSQVFFYKRVFQESLGMFGTEDIEVIILGDTFDPAFDREALGEGYVVMSYVELLERAKGRYQQLYETLAPPDAGGGAAGEPAAEPPSAEPPSV